MKLKANFKMLLKFVILISSEPFHSFRKLPSKPNISLRKISKDDLGTR